MYVCMLCMYVCIEESGEVRDSNVGEREELE